jgi:serine/threonine protein kinase
LKVIDFGIASSSIKAARGKIGSNDVLPGKLGYMSPEQAGRKRVDHRSDIFSLGIVLYEITVGKRLFRGGAKDVVHRLTSQPIEPPTFARRNFPSALEAIVMRTLEKHPEDRYQSAYDLADDLETFLRDARMHSGPVRIARYLDALTAAAGGERRQELVSETELRGDASDELDFDNQMFDSFAPSEGAPGPEQAREWEDQDQPEAEVASALGMDLAELRALRTPVPVRAVTSPGREPPVTEEDQRENPHALSVDDEAATIDAPAKPPVTVEEEGDAPEPPKPEVKTEAPKPVEKAARQPLAESPIRPLPAANPSQRLPWMLVGILGVAVASLVAYIVGT